MTINTRRKRSSAASVGVPCFAPGVVPDGILSLTDRRASGWSYVGTFAPLNTLYLLSAVAKTWSTLSLVAVVLDLKSEVE